MVGRSPLKWRRWIGLIFRRRRANRTQIFLFSWCRIREHDNSIRLLLRSDGTITLVQIKGANLGLRFCDSTGIGYSERSRFGLPLLLRFFGFRFGILPCFTVDFHALGLGDILFSLLGYFRGVTFPFLLIDVHGTVLRLLFRSFSRQPRLILGGRRESHRLHPLLLLFLLLLQLLGIGKSTRLGIAPNLKFFGIFEILIQSNGARGRHGETEHVHEGIPVPVLEPENEARGTGHFGESVARPERQGAVPSADIDESGGQNGSHLGQRRLMLIADDGRQLLAEGFDLAMIARIALLHVNHGRAEQGSLPNVIGHVGEHGFQQCHALGVSRPGHGDADGHATGISDVRVETLQEETYQLRHPLGSFVQHQRQSDDGGHANVVVDVADGGMEQDPNGFIGPRPTVGEGETVHGPVSNDGVSVPFHLLDGGVGVFLLTEVDEGETHGDTADDLFVLRLLGVIP
mmetsp:Transcript_30269/g.63769  ORF Transcript_30269/g.63769 Transcript_30269/m.63769 type:complete len:459 (+) Transcript_30269:163-1539(+)